MEDSQFINILISGISFCIFLLVSIIGYFMRILWKKVDTTEDKLNKLIGEHGIFHKNSKIS
jgi:hypothetical protein